ncbi:MAG TPA: globin domain-containing protein [Thermoanaerobaculia bacterium]|nr:globin domain-containing protein [Thermoanaerobaculia bacterium]
MNARQRELVRSTFERLRPIPKSAALTFYERLFELDPALRPLFGHDLENQAAMFVTALNLAVLELVEPDFIPQSVRALGTRHAHYGVEEPFYATFGQALLWTLGRLLGESFTPEVRDAWSDAYETLAAAMKESAAEVRQEGAAARGGGPLTDNPQSPA